MKKRLSAVLVILAASLSPSAARAQGGSASATADALYDLGHQLYEQKRYAEACPKFAESYRLDPATGSLLALASCHEAEGKLASAWSEYNDTVSLARREGKNDRADAAQARATALGPKLARVTILVPPANEVPGLEVRRDKILLTSGAYGAPLPVDRGEHTFEATAPGYQPWAGRGSIADGVSETVTIPRLLPKTEAAPPVALAPVQAFPSSPEASASSPQASGGGAPLRTIGVVAGVAGLVAAGIGAYFGVRAISKNNESNASFNCVGDICDPIGKQARLDAISAGNTSTALVVVGSVLIAGGVVLFIVGGSSKPVESKTATSRSPSKPFLAATPAVGPSSAGFALTGRF